MGFIMFKYLIIYITVLSSLFAYYKGARQSTPIEEYFTKGTSEK